MDEAAALHAQLPGPEKLHDAPRPAPGPGALRSVAAGVLGALATVAVVLTLGLLAFAPLGAHAAATGAVAAFAAAIVGGIVLALASRASMPVAAPSSATALILAALVAQLVADPQVAAAAASAQPLLAVRWVLAAGACAVLGMGLVQLALAAMRLARLVHFVPQPVLAGFVNGVALLILLAQVPLLLGAPAGASIGAAVLGWLGAGSGAAALAPAAPAAPFAPFAPLLLGLFTAAGIALVSWRRPRWPALLAGFVAGVAVAQLLPLAAPALFSAAPAASGQALPWGPVLSPVTASLPPAAAWLPFFDDDAWTVVARHAPAVALTALLLGLVGALESLLSMVSIEQGTGRRLAPDRELAVLGLANVAGGLVGALPVVLLRAGAVAVLRAGGRGPLASLAVAATMAGVFALAGPWLGAVPLAVLGGVMVMVGVSLVDRWSARLAARWWRAVRRGRLPAGDDTPVGLAVMAVVCMLTVVFGVAVGVGAGVALSLVVFVRRINRSLVRSQFSGMARPSRRVYPGSIEAHLMGLRSRIALLELEGALFFGSAAHLPDRAQALAPPVRYVILDLRRVSTIDESGAMLMHELALRLARQGQELLLAGVIAGGSIARGLKAFAPWLADGAPRTFADADQAMEAAEAGLLAEAAATDPQLAALLASEAELPLAACSLVRGLDARELQRVAAAMQRRDLAAGEVVFRQGDEAEALYVVTRGSVSAVVVVRDAQQRVQRYASLGPGTMFGEMALLDHAGRSADAVADGPACLWVLSREGLDELLRDHPVLAAKLYRNIAAHLGERLRVASMAWQAAAA